MTDAPAPERHPLDVLREEAQTTNPQDVRRSLDSLSQQHFSLLQPHGWAAGAEETLRTAIGMERKAQMEMRIGLGDDADRIPIRKTRALGDMTLPELLSEYRENRQMTLQIIDLMLETGQRRAVRVWTMGEEVPPELHIMSVRSRLRMLGEKLAEQRIH